MAVCFGCGSDDPEVNADNTSPGEDPGEVEIIEAALLRVDSGCDTYKGAHPLVPDHPTEVLEYVFCADGTAEKRWNPNPGAPMPGPWDGAGTWSYDGNELTITTTAAGPGGPPTGVDTYGVAFTYDDGGTEKLDLYSLAQTAPGDGSTIIGSYASEIGITVDLPGLVDMDAVSTIEMQVTDGNPASWAQTVTRVVTCPLSSGIGCIGVQTGTFVIDTNGTVSMPGSLYELGSTYVLQVDDTLVLERKPNETCKDADGDGFFSQEGCGTEVDCNDDDADVNPAVIEAAFGDPACRDQADNDCDGLTDGEDGGCKGCIDDGDCDDGNACTDEVCLDGGCMYTGRDADGDGFVDDACDGTDCDDSDENVNPGVTEGPEGDVTCSDQIDNDCDGVTDVSDGGCSGQGYLPVDSINPLSVGRSQSLSTFTLIMDGYQWLNVALTSEVILLDNENKMALWIYDGQDVGGLLFAHNAELAGKEIVISDTEHDRVIVIEAANDIYSSDPGFQMVWNSDDDTGLSLDYPNDANFLANGNLLITDRDNHRVIEVNRSTGEIEWQFGVTDQPGNDDEHLNGPHNADRLSDGNMIVADSLNYRILEVDPQGDIVWEYAPSGGDALNWPRDADVLDNGNVLITDSYFYRGGVPGATEGRVIEVTRAGEVVWEYKISFLTFSDAYEADKLDNGNILISFPGLANGAVKEVDYSTRQVVWQAP
jgi:outer membrane protein assembly factor BamB